MCRQVIVELPLQVQFAYVDPRPLFDVVLDGIRAVVQECRLGCVHGHVSLVLQSHAQDVLIGLHVRGQSCTDVPECDELSCFWILHGYVVMHPPHQLYGESRDRPVGVGWHRVTTHHSDLGVMEGFHQSFQRMFILEDVVGIEQHHYLSGFGLQDEVDGGVLPFSGSLWKEFDLSVFLGEGFHDGVGGIGTSAGYDIYIFDLTAFQLLSEDRTYRTFDVLLLVVCAYSYRYRDPFPFDGDDRHVGFGVLRHRPDTCQSHDSGWVRVHTAVTVVYHPEEHAFHSVVDGWEESVEHRFGRCGIGTMVPEHRSALFAFGVFYEGVIGHVSAAADTYDGEASVDLLGSFIGEVSCKVVVRSEFGSSAVIGPGIVHAV